MNREETGMFGLWEWLIIVLVIGTIVVPWLNRKSNSRKQVTPKRENQVDNGNEASAREVPYSPED